MPEGLARHTLPSARWEQILCLAIEQDLDTCAGGKFIDGAYCLVPERDEPVPTTLAADADHSLDEINFFLAQVHQFRDPHPSGVQHFQHGAISVPERVTYFGR